MKIAILASEGAPYAKSGGLGDVMEALPAALSRIEGNEVVLILPYYKKIKDNEKYQVEKVAEFDVGLGWRKQYCGVMKLTNRADKVTVEAGAEVEDCIIMNNCVIGEGAELKYVILDKDVTVTPGAKVCGTKHHPIVIKKGDTV